MSQKFISKIIDVHELSFQSKWGTLFKDFKNDKGFMSSQYYSLFLLRRIVFSVLQVYLNSIPLLQGSLIIVWSALVLAYCCKYRIFKEILFACSVLFGEFTVFSVGILGMVFFTNDEIEQDEAVELVVVIIVFICILIQGFLAFLQIIVKCLCTREEKKVAFVAKIAPVKLGGNHSAMNTSVM